MDGIGVRKPLKRDAHRLGARRRRSEQDQGDAQTAGEGAAERHGESPGTGGVIVKTDYDLNDDNIKAIDEPRLIVEGAAARDSLAPGRGAV